MTVNIHPPRWRWLNRALYAFFALWLSVWLDRAARVALGGGLVVAGVLLAGSAPDLRSLREAADTAGTPVTARVGGGLPPMPMATAPNSPVAGGSPADYRLREPAGGRAPLVVVDLDQTPLSRHLQRLLGASAALQLLDTGPEYGHSQDLLRQGRALGLLVLPEHLQDSWLGAMPRLAPASNGGAAGSGNSAAPAGELTIDLYSGPGALGRQRAMLAAIQQVLQALPSPQGVPDAPSVAGGGTAAHASAAAPLGMVVLREPSQALVGAGHPPALASHMPAPTPRTAIQIRLKPAEGTDSAISRDTDAPATLAQPPASGVADAAPPALLAPPWLPALLALPVARPGTALLIVQQTLLVVLCMLFSTWTQQRIWPVRRNWSSYLGVWIAVTGMALLGCLGHLLPGWLAGWFDPAPATRWDALAALLLLYAACVAALAVWLASLLRLREGGLVLLALLTLPLLTLAALPAPLQAGLGLSWAEGTGGGSAPQWASLLPTLLQGLSWLLPATPAGHGLALLTEAGAGWADVALDFALLGGIGTFAVAGGLYNWREPLVPAI
ncbi:MAG: hypothetical protein RIQ60_1761 [Pseudomonadota bacterium]|jgi:hypothetical protein